MSVELTLEVPLARPVSVGSHEAPPVDETLNRGAQKFPIDGRHEPRVTLTDPGNGLPLTTSRDEEIPEVVEAFIKEFDLLNRKIEFELDRDTGDFRVQVVDQKTGEVIRQIPPEELARFSEKFREILGLFVDERV